MVQEIKNQESDKVFITSLPKQGTVTCLKCVFLSRVRLNCLGL